MTFTLDLLSILVVVSVALYLRAYIAITTKSLASKADVATIASTVESIRGAILIQEESLHAALERDVMALEARFRLDLPIYRETWDNCLSVRVALDRVRRTSGLSQTIDTPSQHAAYESFRGAFEHVQSSVRRFAPFFAPEITLAILNATLPARVMTTAPAEHPDADHDAEIERQSRSVADVVDLLTTEIRDRLRADVSAVARLMQKSPPESTRSVALR